MGSVVSVEDEFVATTAPPTSAAPRFVVKDRDRPVRAGDLYESNEFADYTDGETLYLRLYADFHEPDLFNGTLVQVNVKKSPDDPRQLYYKGGAPEHDFDDLLKRLTNLVGQSRNAIKIATTIGEKPIATFVRIHHYWE